MGTAQISNVVELLCHDVGSKKRLYNALSRMARDEDHVLFDKPAVSVVLDYAKNQRQVRDWLSRMANISSSVDGLPFGRSVGTYASTKEIWNKFQLPEKDSLRWSRTFQLAFQKVADRYSNAKLKPLEMPRSVEGVKQLLSEWHTSGGWDSILYDKRYKGEILTAEFVASLFDKMDAAIGYGRFRYPIVPGSRTQCVLNDELTDCKHKKRPINMVSLTVVLWEAIFANPIGLFLTHYPYSAIGKDDLRDIPQFIHNRLSQRYDWVSLDYSAYDATLPSWLLRAAFDVLKGMFQLTPKEAQYWDVIVNTFIIKDLVTPDGVIHVTHGNPSGSKFTAIINGVCNEIMTEYWANILHRHVEYMIMGDDNLIFFTDSKKITLLEIQRIEDILGCKFGIVMNASKTDFGSWTDVPRFLSREWRFQGAWRPPVELLSLIAYPERFRDYHGGVLTPEILIFSYILSCPAGMFDLIDVDRFLVDHPTLRSIVMSREVLREMPWSIQQMADLIKIHATTKRLPYGLTIEHVA